jgi:hypothetical protein
MVGLKARRRAADDSWAGTERLAALVRAGFNG